MTNQEFETKILEALGQMDAARAAQPYNDAFQDVLCRFARTLEKHPAIGAEIEEEAELPSGRRLVLWPKLRRDERATMLIFARIGEALRLFGRPGHRDFRTAAELEEYLLQDFLRAPAFAETLAFLTSRCNEPVTGFLRRGGPSEVSPGDVLLHLDPVEQRKLAEAEPGRALEVLAREDRKPLTSLYEERGSYTCLVAGGYGIWVTDHARAADGRLCVRGPAMREDELG